MSELDEVAEALLPHYRLFLRAEGIAHNPVSVHEFVRAWMPGENAHIRTEVEVNLLVLMTEPTSSKKKHQTMNPDIIARLDAIEKEQAALRELLATEAVPAPAPSLLCAQLKDQLWYLGGSLKGFTSEGVAASYFAESDTADDGNLFQSQELAQAYAAALNTLLLLRHQPGTKPANVIGLQWTIQLATLSKLEVDDWSMVEYKLRCISPCFATKEAAQAAIDTIGEDRILRMFKTLHHVED